MAFPPARRAFALVAGMAGERGIPRLAGRSFVRGYEPVAPALPVRGSVVLWPDTFNNYLSPEVARAASRVLAAAGFEVTVPGGRVCCGLTWITTGQLDHARHVLRATLRVPELAGEAPIVVLEPSCAAALRRDLLDLLPDDPRAASVARRIATLAELLDGVPIDGLSSDLPLAPLVQPHCHHQSVLGTAADQRLMTRAGIVPTQTLSGCCGLAGNFGAEAGHESISRAVADLELMPAIRAHGQDGPILADGFSCRTQIEFLTGRRARHLAEALDERIRRRPGMSPGDQVRASRRTEASQ
jgi:Fe-S oxidoreductase